MSEPKEPSDPKPGSDEPAVKSDGNMGTTTDATQAPAVDSTEHKPATKPDDRPAVATSDDKPAATKPDDRPATKPDKPAAKPDDKPAATKPDDRPATKPDDKPAATNPDDRPATKPDDKPAATMPDDKPAATKPDDRPATKPDDRPATKPADKPAPKRATRSQRASTQPTNKKTEPDWWDKAAAWLLVHGPLPAVLAITIGVLAIHFRIFWGETAGDDLSFHFAESARIADCIRHFDFDFWNPSANGGYASAYYYQVLPQLASALPAAIFGHHLFWFQLSVVLPLVMAPLCAYKGMRLLGATQWQAVAAAFCVAFMNGASRWGSGNAGTFQVGLYTQTWALCAFPLALGYAMRWMTSAKNLAAAIAWGSFVFLCHPMGGITLAFAVLAAWFAQVVLLPFDYLFAWMGRDIGNRWLLKRWGERPKRELIAPLLRGAILAGAFLIAWMPVWLPLVIDAEGFGGFPARVSDEVGPGFKGLAKWYANGEILDWVPKDLRGRFQIAWLTWLLPLVLIFARASFYRWLWAPAFLYALLLGLGPHIGKIGDDLFPPVRALGALQTVLAMGIGAGVIIIGTHLWKLAEQWPTRAYGIRTGLAAALAALAVLVAVPGGKALGSRVRTLQDHVANRAMEMAVVNQILANQPQGRKLSGPGAENHWWNLLTYAYHRVPATLQMGGGGLQASPNYHFLFTMRDHVKNAWLFDAPYLVFETSRNGGRMPIAPIIAKTWNYEIRRLPTPTIVSPVHVTGVLPPDYSNKGEGHKKALEWVKSDKVMRDEVIAYAGYDKGNTAPPAGKTLRAWRQDSPGSDADIVGEVEVERTTTFTIRESWHPRWHAYIDGEEVPVRRVTPDFPAVDVPPGKHTIEMRFERPWWAQVAWLAWPLTALAAWFVLRRREQKLGPLDAGERAQRMAA